MSCMWIVLWLLLQEGGSFMIYNSIYSLCLQDSLKNHTLQIEYCDLNIDLQQWLWKDRHMLANKVTRRCLSTQQLSPVLTAPCDGSDVLRWQCHGGRLMSHDKYLELTTDGRHLFLAKGNKLSKWKSIESVDICKEHQRVKRASDDSQVLEVDAVESPKTDADEDLMTDEMREYLLWYYRTEDPSSWKYAMLALSFAALLIGCGLLGANLTKNRNRKPDTVQTAEGEKLQTMTGVRQGNGLPAERPETGEPAFTHGMTLSAGVQEEDV